MALPHVMEWPVAGDAATVPTRRPSMSALGQKQTYAPQQVMSALPPKKRTCAFQKLNHCTFATPKFSWGRGSRPAPLVQASPQRYSEESPITIPFGRLDQTNAAHFFWPLSFFLWPHEIVAGDYRRDQRNYESCSYERVHCWSPLRQESEIRLRQ